MWALSRPSDRAGVHINGGDLQRTFQIDPLEMRARTICCNGAHRGRRIITLSVPGAGAGASKHAPDRIYAVVSPLFTEGQSMHPGIIIVAVVFWVFVGVVSVAGMVQDYRKRELALQPLRIAIEHGQQLDPEIISRLLGQDARHEELDPRLLHVGGIITIASGFGVALLSVFVSLAFPPYHWIVMGIGALAVCVGIGLLIGARALRSAIARYPQDKVA
jgi:hypothetical protein